MLGISDSRKMATIRAAKYSNPSSCRVRQLIELMNELFHVIYLSGDNINRLVGQ